MSEYIVTTEQLNWFLERMDETVAIPAAIAHLKPIVRCRDCKFSHEVGWPEWTHVPSDYLDCLGELVETWDYYNDEPNNNPVKPDGFCAWGERREDGN